MDKKRERIGQGIKIKKYDDIFDDGKEASSNASESGGAVLVEPSLLMDFKNHPFKVDGKGIDELLESIREHGILSPIIARPARGAAGRYEIISGHRRKYCAAQLGLANVPVIIKDVDDDEAVLAMVDSNIQREDILPSEKAFAYKMKLEAIKRQGKRTDLTSGQVVQKLDDELTCGQLVQKLVSSDVIGNENNESGRQIRRYIRLTELPPSFLKAIDGRKMSFNAGVELSFLNEDEIKAVEGAAEEMRRFPSLAQAKKLREMADKEEEITVEGAADVLMERKQKKADINFEREEIRSFFPRQFTAEQIEEAVIGILREWKK